MDSITITKEQFDNAVKNALNKFNEIGNEKETDSKDTMTMLMMGLQNALFGGLIKQELFGKE